MPFGDIGAIGGASIGNLGTIWAELGLDYSRLDQGSQIAKSKISAIDREVTSSAQNITNNLNQMGAVIQTIMVGGLMMLSRQMINTFADFEQSMANTISVAGAVGDEIRMMEEAARAAGATTKFSASQAADALYYMASAGMDANQSVASLSGTLALAAATGADLAYASSTVAASLSQFNMDAREAERIANVYAAAIAGSQASLEKLTDAMRYAGPVTAGFGWEIEQTTAALMMLYNAGLRGEQAGTTLRQALIQLANPAGRAKDALASLGLSADDVNPALHSLSEIIDVLSERSITTTQAMQLFGSAAGSGMAALIRQGSVELRRLQSEITGTEAAAEMAAIQMNTLKGSIEELRSIYEELSITLAEKVAPDLRVQIDLLADLLQWYLDLDPVVHRATATFGSMLVVTGSLTLAITKLLPLLAGLFGPAGWFVLGAAGAAGLVAGLRELSDRLNETENAARRTSQELMDTGYSMRDQARELTNLMRQYEELTGKTELTEEEHKKLRDVINGIVDIVPSAVTGYDDMGNALLDIAGRATEARDRMVELYEKYVESALKLAQIERDQAERQLQQAYTQRGEALEYLRSQTELLGESLHEAEDRLRKWEIAQLDAENKGLKWTSALGGQRMWWQFFIEDLDESVGVLQTLGIRMETALDPKNMELVVAALREELGLAEDEYRGVSHAVLDLEVAFAEANLRVGEFEGLLQQLRVMSIEEILTPDSSGEIPGKIDEYVESLDDILDRFEKLKSEGSELVDTYAEQVGWLQKYALEVAKGTGEWQDRAYVEGAIFQAAKAHYEDMLAEERKLTGERIVSAERQKQLLNDIVKQHVISVEQMIWLRNEQRDLEIKAAEEEATARNDAFNAAMDLYRRETQYADASWSERKRIFKNALNSLMSNWQEYEDVRKVVEERLLEFDYRIMQESIQVAEQEADALLQSEILKLRAKGDLREADLQEVQRHYDREVQRATGNEALLTLAWERYQLNRKEINERYDAEDQQREEEELRRAQRVEDAKAQIEILHMQARGEFLDAELAAAKLRFEQESRAAEGVRELERLAEKQYAAEIKEINDRHDQKQLQDYLDSLERRISAGRLLVQAGEMRRSELIELEKEVAQERLRIVREGHELVGQSEMELLAGLKALNTEYWNAYYNEQMSSYRHSVAMGEMEVDDRRKYLDQMLADVIEYNDHLTQEQIRQTNTYRQLQLEKLQIDEEVADERIQKSLEVIEQEDRTLDALTKELRLLEELRDTEEARGEASKQSMHKIYSAIIRTQNQLKNYTETVLDDIQNSLNELELSEVNAAETTLQIWMSVFEQLGLMTDEFKAAFEGVFSGLEQRRDLLKLRWGVGLPDDEPRKDSGLVMRDRSLLDLWQQVNGVLEDIFFAEEERLEQIEQHLELMERLNPAMADNVKQFSDMLRTIREVPMEIYGMMEDFNKLGDAIGQSFGLEGLGALTAGLAGWQLGGDKSTLPGLISSSAYMVSGVATATGHPLIAGATIIIGLLANAWEKAEAKMADYQNRAKQINEQQRELSRTLEEYGWAMETVNVEAGRTFYLNFRKVGWEYWINGEGAAEAAVDAMEDVLSELENIMGTIGSSLADVISRRATWIDFEAALKGQMRRILVEQFLIAQEVEESMRLLVGEMYATLLADPTEEQLMSIRDSWKAFFDETMVGLEELESIFPWVFEDGAEVTHQVKGLQITRLAERDRDMFVEMLRPVSVLDRLPGY